MTAARNHSPAAAFKAVSAADFSSAGWVHTGVLRVLGLCARVRIQMPAESNGLAIPSQPHGQGEEYRARSQPHPQTRAAQESTRSEMRQRIHHGVSLRFLDEGLRKPADQAISLQGGEMRSAERNLFEDANRQGR